MVNIIKRAVDKNLISLNFTVEKRIRKRHPIVIKYIKFSLCDYPIVM
jgi:hypothetical protein